LVVGVAPLEFKFAGLYKIPHEHVLDINVFGAAMELGIRGDLNRGLVVFENDDGLVRGLL
jgi:hypothetical protein